MLKTATVFFPGNISVRCEIRDYCQSGLYLEFLVPTTGGRKAMVSAGAAVEVEFDGHIADAPKLIRLSGEVVHLGSTGLGVYIESLPQVALTALYAARERQFRKAASIQSKIPSDPKHKATIQNEFTHYLHAFLEAVVHDFFPAAERTLSEASRAAADFVELSQCNQVLQQLEHQRAQIEAGFSTSFWEAVEQIAARGKTSAAAKLDPGNLSILDKEEFDDWLTLSGVVYKVESSIAPQLTDIERRYSRLMAVALDRKTNPAGPEFVCQILRETLRRFDFPKPIQGLLYKSFGESLARHYPRGCELLGRALEPIEPVVPNDDHSNPLRSGASGQPTSPRKPVSAVAQESAVPSLETLTNTLIDLSRRIQNGALPSLESPDDKPGNAAPGEQPSLSRRSGPPTVAARSRVSEHGQAPRPGAPDVLSMAARWHDVLQQLSLIHPPTGGLKQTLTAQPAQQSEATLRELVMGLDALPAAELSTLGHSETPSLTQRLNQHLEQVVGGTRNIPAVYRQTLDATGSLLGSARTEHTAESAIERLLQRLERPLLKLALTDASFLSAHDHPAREVFNLLDQCRMATDDRGGFLDSKLEQVLNLLVDRICHRADQDPGVYAAVRDSLKRVLETIRRSRKTRVVLLQEACEGRQRIRSARDIVNQALEIRLGGHEVPEILLRLLAAGWQHYLVLLAVRQNGHGDEWDSGLAVLDWLVEWLARCEPPDALTVRDAQGLLDLVARKLPTVNVDARDVAAFMPELESVLRLQTGKLAPRVGKVLIPTGRFARPRQSDTDGSGAERQLPDDVRVGEWWTFSRDGGWVPMQLIWFSEAAAICAFANRSGTGKLELELAELAEQVANGSAKREKDPEIPLLERSEYAVFDDAYRRLVHQTLHDPVTGLVNRKGFGQELSRVASSRFDLEPTHCICMLEFDQFRGIYSQCGVEAGYSLAQTLTRDILEQIRPHDLLASFGDGTFALLLPDCRPGEGTEHADRLLRCFKDYRFRFGKDNQYSLGVTIGLADYLPGVTSEAEAIRRADSACLTAKSSGRNRIQVYGESNVEVRQQESLMNLAGRINRILEGDSLYLRCQKVIPIADASLPVYYELLLGIRATGDSAVDLLNFIRVVERLKRAHEVDLWVMAKAFEWIRAHRSVFDRLGGFSINLSALSLSSSEVLNFLHGELGRGDLPADKITFEITETAAMSSYGAAEAFIQQIRRYGCKFSLDDFGSGYASYAHLKNLHAHSLKIDGSFVKDMIENPKDHAMVKSMSELGHFLGLRTVAEYCHSDAVLEQLKEIGVDYAQGYAIHEPMAIEGLLASS